MATCENCGTGFEPASGVEEVTSLRILCPACAAARKAERAKSAAARGPAKSAAPVPATVPRPNPAPQRPPARPTTPPRPESAPKSAPRPTPAPTPAIKATPKPTPSAASSRLPAGRPAPAAVVAKPAPAARANRIEPDEGEGDVERSKKLLKKQDSRIIVVGWVAALVLTGVAGGAMYVSRGRQAAAAAERAARVKRVDDFWAQMLAFDIATEEGARQAILLSTQETEVWRGELIDADVTSRVSKAKTFLEISTERAQLRERLEAIELALQDTETLSADFLAEQRRKIDELEPKARPEIVGSEYIARLGIARASAGRGYASRLLAEVKASANDVAGGREALARFATAESEIQKLLDKSIKDKDTEANKFYEDCYREVIKISDALCAQVFTAEVIEKTPWTDLLAGEWVAKWRRSTLAGFDHRIENGVMHITGPDAATGKQGVLAVGQEERWRDFVLDIEYTLAKGSVEVGFRMSVQPDGSVEYFTLSTEGEGAVLAGEKYAAEISLIGSQFEYREIDTDVNPTSRPVYWTKSRWGALCMVVPDGTELRFSRLRIKVLR